MAFALCKSIRSTHKDTAADKNDNACFQRENLAGVTVMLLLLINFDDFVCELLEVEPFRRLPNLGGTNFKRRLMDRGD